MWLAANRAKGPTDWNATDWRQVQRTVRNLRQRIFRASEEGNHRKVRSLQNLMLRSHANALLAVRRVTQARVRGQWAHGRLAHAKLLIRLHSFLARAAA
jgi:RNA-directed DNA polymerase